MKVRVGRFINESYSEVWGLFLVISELSAPLLRLILRSRLHQHNSVQFFKCGFFVKPTCTFPSFQHMNYRKLLSSSSLSFQLTSTKLHLSQHVQRSRTESPADQITVQQKRNRSIFRKLFLYILLLYRQDSCSLLLCWLSSGSVPSCFNCVWMKPNSQYSFSFLHICLFLLSDSRVWNEESFKCISDMFSSSQAVNITIT